MATMPTGTQGGCAMMATGLGDDGDDIVTPRRPADPGRFPTWQFRKVIALGGYYRSSSRYDETRVQNARGEESFFGIPWAALERAGMADVVTVVSRVFITDAERYRLHRKHFLVWLAVECGIIIQANDRGVQEWQYAFPDKPRKVLDDYEAARRFDLSERTVREYRDVAARALDNEWYWLKTRER
jgi:hypothetical protein